MQAPGGAGKTWTTERIRRIGVGRDLRPTLVSVADLAPDGPGAGRLFCRWSAHVWL